MFARKKPAAAAAAIRAEVEKLAAERAGLAPQSDHLAAQIDALASTHAAAVLESDAAAEANEAERRRLGYAQTRLAARLAELDRAESDARQRLADAEIAQRRDEAERAVADAVAALNADYAPAVEKIAAFVEKWRTAAHLAEAAGVDGPEELARPRRCDRKGEPPVYRNETIMEGNLRMTREVLEKPAVRARYSYLPPLATAIALPPPAWGGAAVNPPAEIVREWNE